MMFSMSSGCNACVRGLISSVSAQNCEFCRSDTNELRLSVALFA